MNKLPNSNKKVTIYIILIAFLFFIIGMKLMRTFAAPLSLAEPNTSILDLRLGYSYDDISTYFKALGTDGRNYYANSFYLIDAIYPLTYATFYYLIIKFLLEKNALQTTLLKFCLAIPFIGMFFDYLENVLIYQLLKTYPHQSHLLSTVATSATTSKFIFVYGSVGIIIILLARLLIIYLKNTFPPKN